MRANVVRQTVSKVPPEAAAATVDVRAGVPVSFCTVPVSRSRYWPLESITVPLHLIGELSRTTAFALMRMSSMKTSSKINSMPGMLTSTSGKRLLISSAMDSVALLTTPSITSVAIQVISGARRHANDFADHANENAAEERTEHDATQPGIAQGTSTLMVGWSSTFGSTMSLPFSMAILSFAPSVPEAL